uniref:TatD family deoxyribonuclease n=1 Tax=Thermofilum pendens TaxID=2269 RepID=A0A7C3WPG1_THEPE
MIDVHCHLTYPGLWENLPEVVSEARQVLDAVVTCGLPFDKVKEPGFPGATRALELAESHKDFVYVTLGLHPTQVGEMSDEEVERYIEFVAANRERIVGIGEIGLDNYWIRSEEERGKARRIFLEFLELAEKLNKPAVIHSRDAESEVLDILSSFSLKKVLMHSFTGNMTTAKAALERGYFFSVNYRLTNTKTMKKIAKNFPLESILLETDAPFLSPIGEVNTPAKVRIIAEEVARLRGLPVEIVDEVTTRNAAEFFGLRV